MIRYNQKGTALLVTIFVTMILLTGMFMLWRTVALSYEGAMWHYRAKRQFYASESLACYGMALIKSKLVLAEQLPDEKLTFIYRGNWPKKAQTWGELLAGYDRKKRSFTLQARLFGNDHVRAVAMTQVVCKKTDKLMTVLNWKNE